MKRKCTLITSTKRKFFLIRRVSHFKNVNSYDVDKKTVNLFNRKCISNVFNDLYNFLPHLSIPNVETMVFSAVNCLNFFSKYGDRYFTTLCSIKVKYCALKVITFEL